MHARGEVAEAIHRGAPVVEQHREVGAVDLLVCVGVGSSSKALGGHREHLPTTAWIDGLSAHGINLLYAQRLEHRINGIGVETGLELSEQFTRNRRDILHTRHW